VPNHTSASPVWLFDLDNTLHDASHAIFPAISANMNTYIARVLHDGVTPVTQARVDATLLGMMRHHGVSAADFLSETHDLKDLRAMMRSETGLGRLLQRLPGRKILLTNGPRDYSTQVMRHLKLGRHFAHHIAIEQMQVHRQLRPKPSKLMLSRLLRKHGVAARDCILVEDTLANLKSARQLGLGTVWVTQYLRVNERSTLAQMRPHRLIRPNYVDVKVKSVRQLPKQLRRLRPFT
jgi:putative hydrolase of the HAD superfamily